MAQQNKTDYEGTFNSVTVGLFKNNTAGDIGADDARTLVENTADSVPFTLDDSYTWPFPQVTASGTDTYTATLSPAITAYVAGQKFQILFTNANTGAATLNLNAVGALAITKNGATALAAGDIPAGSIKILAYDGTRLQIIGDGGGGGTAATTSFTPAGSIAATDVQAAIEELDTEKAPLASPGLTGTPTVNGAGVAPGLVPAATTGTAVAFAVPQIYGTPGSPETGNITLTTTGLIVGVIQKMYHNIGTAPTFGAEFVRISGNYVESTLNIIHFEAYSTSRIEYTVTQEI